MDFFVTVEGQRCTETGLSAILAEFTQRLHNSVVGDRSQPFRYGSEFQSIGAIPTCVDDGMWDALGWKERVLIHRAKGEADVRLRMDYEQFVRADENEKRQLFLDIIIRSIRAVQNRSKGDFDGETLIADIKAAFG